MITVSGVEEARLALEKGSFVIPFSEAAPGIFLELTKRLFSKGYDDVEIIGKIADAQICYVDLLNSGGAATYQELQEDIKLNLTNTNYAIENGIISDSATVQATDPRAWEMLDQWERTDADYFTLKNEESLSPAKQIELLIQAARAVASVNGEVEKLDFILRPTELHDNLLKAIMEARGVKMERIEAGGNGGSQSAN